MHPEKGESVNKTELVISINPNDNDTEYRYDLAHDLAEELKDIDGVLSVTDQRKASAQEGEKGLPLDAGTIIAGVAVAANLATIAGFLIQWLSQEGKQRSAKMTLGDKSIEVEGLNKKSHEAFVSWLQTEFQASTVSQTLKED